MSTNSILPRYIISYSCMASKLFFVFFKVFFKTFLDFIQAKGVNIMKKKYPVLLAFERNAEGHLSAWCPFCAKWHHHGSGEGGRAAHCVNPTSPFLASSYILKKQPWPAGWPLPPQLKK